MNHLGLSLFALSGVALVPQRTAFLSEQDPSTHSHVHCSEGGRCGGVRVVRLDTSVLALSAGGSFDINDLYYRIGPEKRAVIEQAVLEWEELFRSTGEHQNPYPIWFEVVPEGHLDPGVLALTNSYIDFFGNPVQALVEIASGIEWYSDATPWEDSEFNPDGSRGPPGFDLLTVMRHEIGHALGWSEAYDKATELVVGTDFDPGRWNIGLDPLDPLGEGYHANGTIHPDSVMRPVLGVSLRRWITLYPDVTFVARAMNYHVVMKYVTPVGPSPFPPLGHADIPYISLPQAVMYAPPGSPLLFKPGQYGLNEPLVISKELTLSVARGGEATIGAP